MSFTSLKTKEEIKKYADVTSIPGISMSQTKNDMMKTVYKCIENNVKNSPPNTYTFVIEVDSKLKESDLICKWYESFLLGNHEEKDFNSAKIVAGTVKKIDVNQPFFKVTYKTSSSITPSEMRDFNNWLADPDDDGNYPIVYKGRRYGVAGSPLELVHV